MTAKPEISKLIAAAKDLQPALPVTREGIQRWENGLAYPTVGDPFWHAAPHAMGFDGKPLGGPVCDHPHATKYEAQVCSGHWTEALNVKLRKTVDGSNGHKEITA